MYTRLQSPLLDEDARRVGRILEWLYTLRQKADYEMDPEPAWRAQLQDAEQAATLARHALDLSGRIQALDFSPVVFLLDPGLSDLHG